MLRERRQRRLQLLVPLRVRHQEPHRARGRLHHRRPRVHLRFLPRPKRSRSGTRMKRIAPEFECGPPREAHVGPAADGAPHVDNGGDAPRPDAVGGPPGVGGGPPVPHGATSPTETARTGGSRRIDFHNADKSPHPLGRPRRSRAGGSPERGQTSPWGVDARAWVGDVAPTGASLEPGSRSRGTYYIPGFRAPTAMHRDMPLRRLAASTAAARRSPPPTRWSPHARRTPRECQPTAPKGIPISGRGGSCWGWR